MRTTITIDDEVLKELKVIAAKTQRSLNEVVGDALRESLARRKALADLEPVKLHTFKGDGLQPGVDINNSASLLDLMDAYDADSRR